MLIRFSVKNFRSFSDEEITLDMVSSTKIKRHPGHICSTTLPIKVLRDAVVYGANAAGKSNLMKAFNFFVDSARSGSLPEGIAGEFCRTLPENESKQSVFDIQIEVDGLCFDYGFSCILSQRLVTEEWLYRLDGKKSVPLFRRSSEGIELFVPAEESGTRFDIYRDDFLKAEGVESPALFMTNMNKGKSFDESSDLAFFGSVYRWFADRVKLLGAGMPNPNWNFYLQSDLDDVARLLSSFDTGISEIRKKEIPFEELSSRLPKKLIGDLRTLLENMGVPRTEDARVGVTIRTDQVFVGIEKRPDGALRATLMEIHHGKSPFEYDYGDESDGTKRLFDLIDMLLDSEEDVLYIVDELSRSLHPLLTQHLIELFNEVHSEDRCQLVFTTHENDIMSFDFFRRDEIWFVERTPKGESMLYPLDEFVGSSDNDGVRSDTRINKQYMLGRYGGIPVLSVDLSLEALEG